MTKEELEYNRHAKGINSLIDLFRKEAKYIAEQKGVNISLPSIIRTEKGEDLILELYSEDTKRLREAVEKIMSYKGSVDYGIINMKLRVKAELRKEEVNGGVRIILSFILPNDLLEIRNRIQEEMEREMKKGNLFSDILEELMKRKKD